MVLTFRKSNALSTNNLHTENPSDATITADRSVMRVCVVKNDCTPRRQWQEQQLLLFAITDVRLTVTKPRIVEFTNREVNPNQPSEFNCTVSAFPTPLESDIRLQAPDRRSVTLVRSVELPDYSYTRMNTFMVSRELPTSQKELMKERWSEEPMDRQEKTLRQTGNSNFLSTFIFRHLDETYYKA